MALRPFVGPWPLLQFRNLFYTDGRTPWTSDQYFARSLPTHRTTQTQKAHTNIHALSGIQIHDPRVRMSEDSSCFRPRGRGDRPLFSIGVQNCPNASQPAVYQSNRKSSAYNCSIELYYTNLTVSTVFSSYTIFPILLNIILV
jgi:hypothetical protein